MHVAVDDHLRYATVSVIEDEIAESVTKHLIETYQLYASKSIDVKRVLTYNGSGYRSKMLAEACQTLNVKHIFTKPYTPQTNGERRNVLYERYCASGLTRGRIRLPTKEICFWTHLYICLTSINGFSPVYRLVKKSLQPSCY